MGNAIRWTPEQFEEYRKRAEEQGRVKTHVCKDEARPWRDLPVIQTKEDRQPKRRVSKYGNVKAEAEGHTFASKHERTRWMKLRLEEKAGAIKALKRQVVYPIQVNGVAVCDYIADFEYERDGRIVTEDAKGYRTDIFKLKVKLMRAVHGIEVLET